MHTVNIILWPKIYYQYYLGDGEAPSVSGQARPEDIRSAAGWCKSKYCFPGPGGLYRRPQPGHKPYPVGSFVRGSKFDISRIIIYPASARPATPPHRRYRSDGPDATACAFFLRYAAAHALEPGRFRPPLACPSRMLTARHSDGRRSPEGSPSPSKRESRNGVYRPARASHTVFSALSQTVSVSLESSLALDSPSLRRPRPPVPVTPSMYRAR
jgi:hypothetical protein